MYSLPNDYKWKVNDFFEGENESAFTVLPEVKFDTVGCLNDPITVGEKI